MPAETVTTEHELRERAEELPERVKRATPAWLVELSELADELEERYPPEPESPFERLRRVHAELMGASEDEPSLANRRPALLLIRGGRDDV